MPARIAKYPPVSGLGNDFHSVMPPSAPPAPPNPAPIPSYPWLATASNPAPGFLITGKWSWHRVTTEGVGNTLAGHDWGFGQGHFPVPPLTTPSLALRMLGSQVKYWLPSSPNTEPQDGSPPGIQGKGGPVAVSTPAFVTSTQDCQDISGWGFCAPTSFCFQQVSAREVGFTLGDLVAGLISMAADSAAALLSRAIGGPAGTSAEEVAKQLDDAIVGVVVGSVCTLMVALLPPESQGVMKVVLGTGAGIGTGGASGGATALGSGLIGAGGDWAGGAAQQAIDGKRSPDAGALDS